MDIIRPFDPWKSQLCICPDKYSLNPYTGCNHGCIYCYGTYIPNFRNPRRKRNLLMRVRRDLGKIPSRAIISMSNSSDPYLRLDKEHKDTRKLLELFRAYEVRVLLITKSDLVLRDIDLISELKAAVTLSISSLREEIYQKLEPNAPKPKQRLGVVKELVETGIPTGLRLDPIFFHLMENERKIKKLNFLNR